MEFNYRDEILNLGAFQTVFTEIKSMDPKMGENIQLSLESAVKESHELLINAKIKEELQLALFKEQIIIQSQSSQYLNITDEITQQKNKLLEFKPIAYHEFMQEVETNVASLMQSIKLKMHREIEKDGTWYSGLRDSGKKSGGVLINATVKGINKLSKEFQGKQIIEKEKVVDSNSIVETVLEKHLNSEKVAKEISEILSTASKNYEKKWIEQISINIPNINRLSAYSISNLTKNNIKIDFQYGAAEQVLTMGLGSAVVGAVGLAAGWHTMTYAMLNVFPPVALFAAAATVFVGVITKEKAVVKRKKEIDDAVNQYHHHFLLQLYSMELQALGNKSTSIYFEIMGNKIVEEAVRQWEENYFGDLNIDHFRMLNQAFVKHLLYVNEAIEQLD